MENDRRKYYRIKDNQIKVTYKTAGASSPENEISDLDLSVGGMRLPLKEKVKPETVLMINILLPKKNLPFTGLIKVIWQAPQMSKAKDGRNYYETGIEFIQLDFQKRKRLAKYIIAQVVQNTPPTP